MDARLEIKALEIIALIADAQKDDGTLDTI